MQLLTISSRMMANIPLFDWLETLQICATEYMYFFLNRVSI